LATHRCPRHFSGPLFAAALLPLLNGHLFDSFCSLFVSGFRLNSDLKTKKKNQL
jgi:hypothetical protein